MKSSKIHEGLDKKEIRDFISISIVKNYEIQCGLKKEFTPYSHENPFENAVKNAEQEVVYWQSVLKISKEIVAIHEIIKMNGWNEFDVADETINDSSFRLKMNFIGTQLEYNNFIESLEKES